MKILISNLSQFPQPIGQASLRMVWAYSSAHSGWVVGMGCGGIGKSCTDSGGWRWGVAVIMLLTALLP